MVAMSNRIPAPLSPLGVEAKAIEIAVAWTLEMGFREVTFETDSLNLFNALKGVSATASSVETITDNILFQAQNYSFFDVTHVRRKGNKPDHILVQYDKKTGSLVVWLEETPSLSECACAQDVILNNQVE